MPRVLLSVGLVGCGPFEFVDVSENAALAFSGDGCAHAVADGLVPIHYAFTFEATLRGDPAPSRPEGVLFAISNQSLLWTTPTQTGWTDRLDPPYSGVVANVGLYDGARHHVAAVWGRDGAALYVDGVAYAAGDLPVPRGMSEVHLGCRAGGRQGFDGVIDEARLSSVGRYLDPFAPPVAPFVPDDETVALWHLDVGSGPVALDEVGRYDAWLDGDATWVGGLVGQEDAMETGQ